MLMVLATTSMTISTDKTGLQYLRARYYDARSGRFTQIDPFAGNQQDPLSLHKYLYVHANPVMGIDPSGLEFSVAGLSAASSIGASLNSMDAQLGQSVISALGDNLYVDPLDVLLSKDAGILPSFIFDAFDAIGAYAVEHLGQLGFASTALIVAATIGANSGRLLGGTRAAEVIANKLKAHELKFAQEIVNFYQSTI